MADYEPWQQRLAWQIAWQVRGCPPERLISSMRGEPSYKSHVETCPFCQEPVTEEQPEEAWETLSKIVSQSGPRASEGVAKAPTPGQVWSVRAELGGWGPKNRYYNPPLVLILALTEPGHEAALVAQLYHDPVLAGPGDVMLTGDLFAETWNTYTLAVEDLEYHQGDVTEVMLKQVVASAGRVEPHLDEGENSVLMAFRRLEVEVGAFCASQSVGRLMACIETTPVAKLLERFPKPEALREYLRSHQPLLNQPAEGRTVPELLALVSFPAHELPLAAATEGTRIIGSRAQVSESAFLLEPAAIELSYWDSSPEGCVVGGRFLEPCSRDAELLAWWLAIEMELTPAVEIDFAPDTGYFRLVFEDLSPGAPLPHMLRLLICETLA